MNLKQAQKTKLSHIAQKYKLGLLYLFGSQVKGQTNLHSDFDIGYIPSKKISYTDESNMISDLSKIFSGPIDLCNFQTASPLLKMQAVKNGLMLAGEKKVELNFKVKTIAEYLDTAKLRRLTREYNRAII